MVCLSGIKVGIQQFQITEQTAGLKRAVSYGATGEMLPPAGYIVKMLRPIVSPFWEY